MRRLGRIVAVPGPARAIVELDDASACTRCANGRGCGAALFTPPGRSLRLDCALEAIGTDGEEPGAARVGARVEVTLAASGARWLVPVALAYGLPTLGLLAGALAPEPWTPFAAAAGLGGGLLAWRACGAGASGAFADASPGGAGREGPCRPVARTTSQPETRTSEGAKNA